MCKSLKKGNEWNEIKGSGAKKYRIQSRLYQIEFGKKQKFDEKNLPLDFDAYSTVGHHFDTIYKKLEILSLPIITKNVL